MVRQNFKSVAERLEHLYKVISSHRFLKMQGLNNEVPFFICAYQPEDAVEIEQLQAQLVSRLEQSGVRILQINIYDLTIALLQERGIWQQIIDIETSVSKEQLKELLQGVLDPDTHLVPAIAQKMQDTDFDVIFLNGVGEVFPYIRTHSILNNLQSTATQIPTLIFFPGEYTHSLESGASLELFGRLRDDRYYRAFNIADYEV